VYYGNKTEKQYKKNPTENSNPCFPDKL